jgi:hypothetical protein
MSQYIASVAVVGAGDYFGSAIVIRLREVPHRAGVAWVLPHGRGSVFFTVVTANVRGGEGWIASR